MNLNEQPIRYGSKWHEGWWYLVRIRDGVESIIPGPHFDNQQDAVLTARYLTMTVMSRQEEARRQTAGATANQKYQGE